METAKIIVLGSVNTDLVIRGPRLPGPGETVLGGQFYRAHGGKGANQAVAAARASRVPVLFIAAVGDDDFGRQAWEHLTAENLDCRYMTILAGEASGVALIMVDQQGENLIGVASGANMRLTPEQLEAVPDLAFKDAGILLTCLESPLETVQASLVRAREAGLTTILNPAPADASIIERGLLPMVDVITPNEGEAAMLTGVDTGSPEGAIEAGRRLRQLGCESCIITLGPAGCVVVEENATWIEGLRVEAVDATAAGDAFNGALAVALAEGRPLGEAARWANRAAAIAVTRRGAQPSLPVRAEIEGA